jgi:hypothetical protein
VGELAIREGVYSYTAVRQAGNKDWSYNVSPVQLDMRYSVPELPGRLATCKSSGNFPFKSIVCFTSGLPVERSQSLIKPSEPPVRM